MGAPDDPFHIIKAEIDQELQQLTSLQAKLFGGHGEVADSLRDRLAAAAEQLQALEAAVGSMVAEPSKFGLTAAAAFGRQVEVETLRYTLSDLQETCAQAQTSSSGRRSGVANGTAVSIELPSIPPPGSSASQLHGRPNGATANHSSSSKQGSSSSSSIPRLPAGPPIRHSKLVQSRGGSQPNGPGSSSSGGSSSKQPLRPGQPPQQPGRTAGPLGSDHADDTQGWGDAGAVSYEAMMQQQMRQQDEALDHISIHVDRIKQTGLLMHEELEEQAGLLSGLEQDTDTTHLRLRALRKKVSDVIKQSRKDRQLCTILVLSVVLVVLTILAIA